MRIYLLGKQRGIHTGIHVSSTIKRGSHVDAILYAKWDTHMLVSNHTPHACGVHVQPMWKSQGKSGGNHMAKHCKNDMHIMWKSCGKTLCTLFTHS